MLLDFFNITSNEFWDLVNSKGEQEKTNFITLWNKADEQTLTTEEAISCLNSLFIYSHLRIKEKNKNLATYYPTKQYSKNRLLNTKYLWWVDHFTAGISVWSTLNWFSAKKRQKKDGTLKLAGASTHFIQGYHGHPFYIIPLIHSAWHEPRRNKDSISIEMVNAGGLKQNKKTGEWSYWANKIPDALLKELPPVLLDKPYKGLTAMQPFTLDQIKANIKIKRICIAALDNKLEKERMSQHSDWRRGKTDMGVLWPFEACNSASFANDPIPELDFIQAYDQYLNNVGEFWDDTTTENDETDNPEYGINAPTRKEKVDSDSDYVLDITQIQTLLVKKGYVLTIDGHMGPKTKKAVKEFQQKWNNENYTKNKLVIDGIPGPKTCICLKQQS